MGDMIMALPMIEMLNKDFSDLEIDVFTTNKSSVFAIKNNPIVNNIFTCNYSLINLLDIIFKLRTRKYYASFVTSISFKSKTIKLALFSYLIQAKYRFGEYLKSPSIFYTKSNKFSQSLHRVDSNLNLLSLLTDKEYIIPQKQIKLYLDQEALSFANEFVKNKFSEKSKIVIIHPGSSSKGKHRRWNKDYFVELIQLLKKEKSDYKFCIIAGPDEEDTGRYIAKKTYSVLLIKKSLEQIAALISISFMMINTDSGISHIAACFDIKLFTIFGPGDVNKTAPFSKKSIVIKADLKCQPCLYPPKNCPIHCLAKLTPKIVFNRIINNFNS